MFRNLWPFFSLQNPCDNHLLNDLQGDIKHIRYAVFFAMGGCSVCCCIWHVIAIRKSTKMFNQIFLKLFWLVWFNRKCMLIILIHSYSSILYSYLIIKIEKVNYSFSKGIFKALWFKNVTISFKIDSTYNFLCCFISNIKFVFWISKKCFINIIFL